jgi:hypothetical protein
MDVTQYGPFAAVIAVAAALAAAFSLLLLKAIGKVTKWSFLIDNSPPILIKTGARALSFALIALTFVLISRNNYFVFVALAIFFGIVTFWLIATFDRMRKVHIFGVPLLQANGTQAIDKNGAPLFKNIVIGTEENMIPEVKVVFAEARRKRPGLSLTEFMGGFGGANMYDPEAMWTRTQLADISSRITTTLMGILLCAVMALYESASVVEVMNRAP